MIPWKMAIPLALAVLIVGLCFGAGFTSRRVIFADNLAIGEANVRARQAEARAQECRRQRSRCVGHLRGAIEVNAECTRILRARSAHEAAF